MKALLISIMLTSTVNIELTPENVYQYCIEQEIAYPEIVTAQAIVETGWFECESCSLNRNNIFGFYYKGSYLEFDHWTESVDYYKKWQDKRYDSDRDYYEFLSCISTLDDGRCTTYAANPEKYEVKLKSIINKYWEEWQE